MASGLDPVSLALLWLTGQGYFGPLSFMPQLCCWLADSTNMWPEVERPPGQCTCLAFRDEKVYTEGHVTDNSALTLPLPQAEVTFRCFKFTLPEMVYLSTTLVSFVQNLMIHLEYLCHSN